MQSLFPVDGDCAWPWQDWDSEGSSKIDILDLGATHKNLGGKICLNGFASI